MTTAIGEKRYTVADLELLEDPEAYELIDGDLVERAMGFESDQLNTRLIIRLGSYALATKAGEVVASGTGLDLYGRRDRLPRPDGLFIAAERVPYPPEQGYLHTAPDIVWEVVSPHDHASRLRQKVSLYLEAGIRLVWVIYPELQEIVVHRATGDSLLKSEDALTGEDVLPGFSVPVADLFATLAEVPQA